MSYFFFFLRFVSKGKGKQPYRNTVNNNHVSPNTISQNDEIPHTARPDDTTISHVKIKITEIPHEKKPNTVNPHVPLSELWLIFCLGQPKSIKTTFQATTFKNEENLRPFQGLAQKLRTFQGLSLKFKDFSRWCPPYSCKTKAGTEGEQA